MQVTGTSWISLEDLLREYVPGSQPQPWSWDDEAASLDAFVCACCDQPGHYQRSLEDWLRGLGHVPGSGICLGGDGRIWDGHHRVVAAIRLGFPGLPVESD